ncbi:MAG: cation diffusion facilitator family transporter [Oscillospiraceae bacterium]|jgi:cation diffusion facilitator family transporter|nr:cation diffusion facilitator family transporter [Oscillospiraceae bacterium]
MIRLLAKLFIKNNEDCTHPDIRKQYGILCGAVGIFFNLLLFSIKLLAGLLSGSIAVTADAFNNLSDAGSSIVTLFGFKLAGQKADSGHPFGHGRIEYVSGFLVSMLILLMGVELLKSSIKKIVSPEPVTANALTVIILLVSVGVKLYMFVYNKKIGKRIHSAALSATAIDSISDTVATSVVLLSMLFTKFTGIHIDAYCGALVSVFILYSGVMAAKETLNPLLGQAPAGETVEKIRQIVLSHEQIAGMHDLMIHDYGPGRCMVSLHAEVSADADLCVMHDLVDDIENDLSQALSCDAVIHIDPLELDDEHTSEIRRRMGIVLQDIDPGLGFHDFRVVSGATRTKLIFDVVVPFHFTLDDKELLATIDERIKQEFGEQYFSAVKIDKAYTPS